MQAVVFLVIPGGMAFAVWRVRKSDRRARAEGGGYAPPGRIRWEGQGEVVPPADGR